MANTYKLEEDLGRTSTISKDMAGAIGFIGRTVAETSDEAAEEMASLRKQFIPVDAIAKSFYPSIYRRSQEIAKAVVYQATYDYFTQKEVEKLRRENLKRACKNRKK